MADRIPVAVYGFGAFGRNHARVYQAMEGVELAAIVEPDEARRAEARALYPEASVAAELEADGIAAASVAVPTEFHLKVAEELLLSGVPCLVEKPLAPDLASAGRLLTVSRNVGVPVFVGHLERFNPALLAARGEIEDARFIEVHRLGSFSSRSLDIDVVLDLMVHDLDVLLTLTGVAPTTVEAIGVNVLTPKVDIANARLTFPSGLVANVTASRVSKERIRKLRVFQPHCYISLDFARRAYEIYRVEPPAAPGARPEVVAREVTPEDREPLAAELGEFLDCVRTGAKPATLATGEDGRAALALALDVIARMRGVAAQG